MFACSYKGCDKIYSTKYSLQRHCLIRHRKSKRFSCKICKKILSSNQNLKEHFYTHSQEKPLQCPFPGCQKVFRQSSQLSTHKKLHGCEIANIFQDSPETRIKVLYKQLTQMIDVFSETDETALNSFSIPKIFDPQELIYSLRVLIK
jgi:uncharacterized Zn-finger protein